MTANQLDKSDSQEPALILKYGNTIKKHFLLDHGSTVLGRSRGCDVELDAQDVSQVHCVVTRGEDGLLIRDLASRSGTRVNGERIRTEGPLRDGDVLQVGTFSFDVVVPRGLASRTTLLEVALSEARYQVEKLERSRDRMAEVALALKQRQAATQAAAGSGNVSGPEDFASWQQELERRTALLEEAEHGLNQRQAELEAQARAQAEQVAQADVERRQVSQHREQVLRELATLQEHLEKREQELAREQTKSQGEIRAAFKHLEEASARSRGVPTSAEDEEHRKRRRRELGSYARYLRESRRRLQARQQEFAEREERVNASWGQLLAEQDRMLDEQARFAAEKQEAERLTAASHQTGQVGALLESLARLYAESRRLHDAELAALRNAYERMQAKGDEAPAPARFSAPAATTRPPDNDATPLPNQTKRGRLTERVGIGALLERIRNSDS